MQLTFAAYFLEVGQTVIGKSNGVRYKDGNKNIVKRKTSKETFASAKRPYLIPFSPNRRDCDRWLCYFT